MAKPKTLARPPIVEAIVHFHIPPVSIESIRLAVEHLTPQFPKVEEVRTMTAQLQVKEGKLQPPTASDFEPSGFKFDSADGLLTVQARQDGLSIHNVDTYLGGDRLLAVALDAWTRFADAVRPTTVVRVAFRHINKLTLPLLPGGEFAKYLTRSPELPEPSPQNVSEFLTRIVSRDGDKDGPSVIVTQRLGAGPKGQPELLLDIDAIQVGEFSPNAEALSAHLVALRTVGDRVFFSLLTDEAVNLYL